MVTTCRCLFGCALGLRRRLLLVCTSSFRSQLLDERNQQGLCLLAECCVKLGKPDSAREYLDTCIATNADYKRPYLLRGKLLASDHFKNFAKVCVYACVRVRVRVCMGGCMSGCVRLSSASALWFCGRGALTPPAPLTVSNFRA